MEYKIGEQYELGKYLGIITVIPFGKDYVEKVHKFAIPSDDPRNCAIINEIFIERLPR